MMNMMMVMATIRGLRKVKSPLMMTLEKNKAQKTILLKYAHII